MNKFVRYCIKCGKRFEAGSSVAKYCSDKHRQEARKEQQRLLMKKRRREDRIKRVQNKKPLANNKVDKFVNSTQTDPLKKRMDIARRKKDWETYYILFKESFLMNEEKWGYQGRYLVNGFEIHDPNFISGVLETIQQQGDS